MVASTSLLLIAGFLGQGPSPASEKADGAAARLDFMKKSVAVYDLRPADDPKAAYRLLPEPVLRFTNTVGTVTDGTIFLWVDAAGRPAAAVQVFQNTSGNWYQAFSSLSTAPLSTGRVWNPSRAGVAFKPVPGAPRPADTPERRMRQMHELLKGFGAEMNLELKTWHTLRPLTKPLARYGKAGTDVVDGALFAYVLTTDPEVYLLLEVRAGKGGPEWQFAFAPEANAPMRGSWKGKNVWDFPFQDLGSDGGAPYFVWVIPDAPRP